ncbi:MAG: PIN domain-containing protein [Terracidiphilus sp.]|jgi:predicted nucleic acid-binding protein
MIVYVLDSSAVLRFVDKEVGAERVRAIFRSCAQGQTDACSSALQWGEIAGTLRKRSGAKEQERILAKLMGLQLRIVPATGERAVRAAEIKMDRKLPYADAFALELAMDTADHVLVTADYDFKAVADLARIEFLPAK